MICVLHWQEVPVSQDKAGGIYLGMLVPLGASRVAMCVLIPESTELLSLGSGTLRLIKPGTPVHKKCLKIYFRVSNDAFWVATQKLELQAPWEAISGFWSTLQHCSSLFQWHFYVPSIRQAIGRQRRTREKGVFLHKSHFLVGWEYGRKDR